MSSYYLYIIRMGRGRIECAGVFVIRDSDCSSPQPIEEQLPDILEASGFTPEFPVQFFAIPCMPESLRLGDLGSFPAVAAQRGHGEGMAPLSVQIANSNTSGEKDAF